MLLVQTVDRHQTGPRDLRDVQDDTVRGVAVHGDRPPVLVGPRREHGPLLGAERHPGAVQRLDRGGKRRVGTGVGVRGGARARHDSGHHQPARHDDRRSGGHSSTKAHAPSSIRTDSQTVIPAVASCRPTCAVSGTTAEVVSRRHSPTSAAAFPNAQVGAGDTHTAHHHWFLTHGVTLIGELAHLTALNLTENRQWAMGGSAGLAVGDSIHQAEQVAGALVEDLGELVDAERSAVVARQPDVSRLAR
jgi:hypothetical protein